MNGKSAFSPVPYLISTWPEPFTNIINSIMINCRREKERKKNTQKTTSWQKKIESIALQLICRINVRNWAPDFMLRLMISSPEPQRHTGKTISVWCHLTLKSVRQARGVYGLPVEHAMNGNHLVIHYIVLRIHPHVLLSFCFKLSLKPMHVFRLFLTTLLTSKRNQTVVY